MSDNIYLKGCYVVKKVVKKTKAKFFSLLAVEDVIVFSITLETTSGASGNGLYATMIDVFCRNKNIRIVDSVNSVLRVLKNFEVAEL